MFDSSADFYDLLYANVDYNGEVTKLHELIAETHPNARTLLDLGCGTGRHLEMFGRLYEPQGLDLNPALLKVAQTRCPDITFHTMDMAGFALDSSFDIITCLFSAIGYVRTPERLVETVAAAARHLNPGGLFLVEPW